MSIVERTPPPLMMAVEDNLQEHVAFVQRQLDDMTVVVEGEAATVSELFVGGGVAGIHMVATKDAYRRRGLGMALTWQALEEGRRRGLATGALQASEAGVSVYQRLGFRECGSFVEYALS